MSKDECSKIKWSDKWISQNFTSLYTCPPISGIPIQSSLCLSFESTSIPRHFMTIYDRWLKPGLPR